MPPELWSAVALHLKPRHLAKLLATSRAMRRAVDTEAYWLRVAAHLVWRECPYLELLAPRVSDPASDLLPPVAGNLFLMVGVDYQRAMEALLARVDLMHRVYGAQQPGQFLAFYDNDAPPASLEARTRLYYKYLAVCSLWDRELQLQGDEDRAPMKTLARRIVEGTAESMDPLLRKSFRFLQELDDDPMPLEFKRRFSRQLAGLLRVTAAEADEDAYPNMAQAIRSRVGQLAFYATAIQ
jgi:hypothetical protein